MKGLGTSRMSLLGLLTVVYGLFMLINGAIGFSVFGVDFSGICLVLGGISMTIGGVYAVQKADVKVTDAIGIFAISYAVFKMLRAISGGGDLWIIPFILTIPFLVMGFKYLAETAKSVVIGVFWCAVYMLVDIAYVITDPNTLNIIDILILAMFASVLISRDVLMDSTLKRNYASTRIEIHGRYRADMNLVKAVLDGMGEWMKHGSAVAKPKLRDSFEEHRVQVAKVMEVAHGPKKKVFHLNKCEEPLHESK